MCEFKECIYCGERELLTIDHFLALSKGGSSNMDNLVPCCGHCNRSKKNKNVYEWLRIKYPSHWLLNESLPLPICR